MCHVLQASHLGSVEAKVSKRTARTPSAAWLLEPLPACDSGLLALYALESTGAPAFKLYASMMRDHSFFIYRREIAKKD